MTRFGAAAARSPHHTIEAPAAQHFAASLPLPGPRAVARRARPWLCPYARASPGTTRTISTSPEAHHDPRSNNREHVLQPPTPFALSTQATTAPPPPRLCARACPLHLLPPTIAPSLPLSGPPSAMGLPVDTRPSRLHTTTAHICISATLDHDWPSTHAHCNIPGLALALHHSWLWLSPLLVFHGPPSFSWCTMINQLAVCLHARSIAVCTSLGLPIASWCCLRAPTVCFLRPIASWCFRVAVAPVLVLWSSSFCSVSCCCSVPCSVVRLVSSRVLCNVQRRAT
jgi:hypothetical protein